MFIPTCLRYLYPLVPSVVLCHYYYRIILDHGLLVFGTGTAAVHSQLLANAVPITHHNMAFLDAHNRLYPRDVDTQLTPNATQRTTLIVAGCYIIAIALLW